jgi:hypothetical protein
MFSMNVPAGVVETTIPRAHLRSESSGWSDGFRVDNLDTVQTAELHESVLEATGAELGAVTATGREQSQLRFVRRKQFGISISTAPGRFHRTRLIAERRSYSSICALCNLRKSMYASLACFLVALRSFGVTVRRSEFVRNRTPSVDPRVIIANDLQLPILLRQATVKERRRFTAKTARQYHWPFPEERHVLEISYDHRGWAWSGDLVLSDSVDDEFPIKLRNIETRISSVRHAYCLPRPSLPVRPSALPEHCANVGRLCTSQSVTTVR